MNCFLKNKIFLSVTIFFSLCGSTLGKSSLDKFNEENSKAKSTISSLLEKPEGACPQWRYTSSVAHNIYQQKNPIEPTPENISIGKMLYHNVHAPLTCKDCHGEEGDGKGSLWGGLDYPPRNFTCGVTMEEIPDGQLFGVIKFGSPGTKMFAYDWLEDEQIWQLVLYIRQFAR